MKALATLLVWASFVLGSVHARAADILPPAVALPARVQVLSPLHAAAYLTEHGDTIIVDARMEEERGTRGHIANSRQYDYLQGQKSLEALAQLDKAKPCLIYCAQGFRAELLAVELHKLGFQTLILLKGGFNAWVAEGLPVVK